MKRITMIMLCLAAFSGCSQPAEAQAGISREYLAGTWIEKGGSCEDWSMSFTSTGIIDLDAVVSEYELVGNRLTYDYEDVEVTENLTALSPSSMRVKSADAEYILYRCKPEVVAPPAQVIDTPSGKYAITFDKGIPVQQTKKLDLLGKDYIKYAVSLCQIDKPATNRPSVCEVFADTGGELLRGSVALSSTWTVELFSDLMANPTRKGMACPIEGIVDLNDDEDFSAFEGGRIAYQAKEVSPRKWDVKPYSFEEDAPDLHPDYNMGVWYIYHRGKSLEIHQERWTYCYPDEAGENIEERFVRFATLKKIRD